MIDPKKQMEEFQYAYVAALAAHAGLNRGDYRVDDDSVDVTFTGKVPAGTIRNPQIQLQLKCTFQDYITKGVLTYPLKLKNYNDLRGSNVVVPRYLAVLVVPEDTSDWVLHEPSCVALHNLCFWASLRNAPATTNETSVSIHIPVAQRLTTGTLTSMILAASEGKAL